MLLSGGCGEMIKYVVAGILASALISHVNMHKIWLHFQLNSLEVVKKKWVIAVVEQTMTGFSKLQLMLIFCSSMNIFIELMLDELHFCKGSVGQII